ncbi:MAG TPA: TonB-dependent receptor [Azospirillaceae bacterium]|nr:TonB-dependent receptor [Azospirillaceae bacterium]
MLLLAAPAAAEEELGEIVVLGRGEARQVQTIAPRDIAAPPGTSPLKAVAKLPGVNFQAADPFGAYEWAVRISVRGFSQNQLGFTLDGVPLGDMSYANANGLHISRAISPENIGRIELSQGAGALDTASTSNLGGALRFFSIDPAEEPGVLASLGVGGERMLHAMARLETGTLPGGGGLYLSLDRLGMDKWKGEGRQRQVRANGRFVQPLGEAVLSGFLNWSDRHENDYQDLSLALIHRLGYGLDNISDDWATAVAIADAYRNGTPFPAPYLTPDDVYFDAAGNRRDLIGGTSLAWPLTDALELRATAYGHDNKGLGTWFTPYTATPAAEGGAPVSVRSTAYDIARHGAILGAAYAAGDHTLDAGVWYEDNDFVQARLFYGLERAAPNRRADAFQDDPFLTEWRNAFDTDTRQFHLRDTWLAADGLKLTAGFRSVEVRNRSRTLVGTPVEGRIAARDGFLPQLGANLRLEGGDELFAGYSRSLRAFVSSRTDGPFSTTQTGFDAIRGRLKPETADTAEGGWRLRRGAVDAVLAGYRVRFHDRLLAAQLGPAIQGNPSALANVGGVTSTGMEAALLWRFLPGWSLFASYAHNRSRYDDDTSDGTGRVVAPTKGKTVVDAPRHLAKGTLAYEAGALSARVSVSAVGRRYYTYLNDGSVPGYALVDAGLGYSLGGVELEASVTNLLDRRHVATVGTNGYVDSDPAGLFQTLQVGSPRQVFLTARLRF